MPICSNPRSGGLRKLDSVGKPAGPELRVLRDPPLDCREAAIGQEGHVVVKGECVTSGYEFRPHMKADPNIEAITDDGWLCTGDKGWLDDDGYLHLSGRFKEIINRGGEKLSPFEIEDVLLRHPRVRDLVAFAVSHELLGECVGVAVVQNSNATPPTLRELRTFGIKSNRLRRCVRVCVRARARVGVCRCTVNQSGCNRLKHIHPTTHPPTHPPTYARSSGTASICRRSSYI